MRVTQQDEIYANQSSPGKFIWTEGLDTSKTLYEVSKCVWGEFLKFLRIPEDSWGFQGILKDSAVSRSSQDHGDSRVSVGFCLNPWGFFGILRKVYKVSLSVAPLDLDYFLTNFLFITKDDHFFYLPVHPVPGEGPILPVVANIYERPGFSCLLRDRPKFMGYPGRV